jgi:hypothetical protein
LAHIAVRRRCGAFWVLAVWAPQVAVAAVPAIYLLVFSTLPLRNALVVTTAINLIPLALVLLGQGVRSPNLRQPRCPCPSAVWASRCGGRRVDLLR